MSQSLVQICVHIIFSTKNRIPFLTDMAFRERVHAYLAGICNKQDCPAIIVGGVADHVHLLCRLGKQSDISTLIREIKRDSSSWVKEQPLSLSAFYWQSGYGAFSISPSMWMAWRTTFAIRNSTTRRKHFKTNSGASARSME